MGTKRKNRRKWTEEELQFLRDNYKEKGPKRCANELNRTIRAITHKRKELNLYYREGCIWTKKEDWFLFQLYPEKGLKECAKYINKPLNIIYNRIKKLCLKKKKYIKASEKLMPNEIKFLIKYYPIKGPKWCSQKLNINRTLICKIAKELSLYCTVETIKKINTKPKKYSLKDCQKFAAKVGWECLSTEYKSTHTLMSWKCANGHIWNATFNNIKEKNTGCPYCSKNHSKYEEITRRIFEYLFDTKFPKTHPKWLINPKTKRALELDGFNGTNLAFEVQGEHHFSKKFKMTQVMFEEIKYKDALKRKLCKKHKVILIEINYPIFNENNNAIILKNILDIITAHKIKICKEKIDNLDIDFLFRTISISYIKIAQKEAEQANLIFLGIKKADGEHTLEWKGKNKKYWYKCKKYGHITEKVAQHVAMGVGKGGGCRICQYLNISKRLRNSKK